MTKDEFLAMAAARYEALQNIERHDNFYDYEKEFDEIWVSLGREVLQRKLGDVPEDRRKKKGVTPDTDRSS